MFLLPIYLQLLLLSAFSDFTPVKSKLTVPTITILTEGTKTSLRGLSVVNDKIIWVSGSNGTIGKSVDGGENWKWYSVKGFEKRDFRDIEAFDATTALIIVVGEPGYILKTSDGGENWKVVYEDHTKGVFLDAMEFWHLHSGIVIGDPIDGKFYILRTFDGGTTWAKIPEKNLPLAIEGEALFAASGTNIRKLDNDEACFVTGGKVSRLFWKKDPITLPIIQGKESTGANSIAIYKNKYFIVVGGDFNDSKSSEKNCFYTRDGGKTWITPETLPNGYRSCVEFYEKKKAITCGLTGVDYSKDGGKNWQNISTHSFHVVRKAVEGKGVFLAGSNGTIARFNY